MIRAFIWIGAFAAFFAVAMGAFGAHALRDLLPPNLMSAYHTGVNYHMWHALGMIGVGLIGREINTPLIRASGWMMLAGILLFSGSLYLLSLTGLTWLGMITPFGGTAFLVAWALLALAVYSHRNSHA